MHFLKKLFDFYINSSIHVALSVFSLVKMTQFMFEISGNHSVGYFAFFGTIVGYNFVKYDALARTQKRQMRNQLKVIATLSFFSLIASGYFFFQLQKTTQIIGFVFLALTLLYTLPFFPNKKNARNWAGIKIYIVALCWVGVTVVLPVLDAEIPITSDFYLKCLQRFILIFVLVLIFEIIDLQTDDPHLQTVPQKIGVKNTKILGMFLLVVLYFLEFFKSNFIEFQLIINLILVFTTASFLFFANEKKSRYYSSFWVELIPVLWMSLVIFFG